MDMHQMDTFGNVKSVNRIFHDIEADQYKDNHPEIYIEEFYKWNDIGMKYFVRDEPITVLDVGTGAGFVAGIVALYMKPTDNLICTDISQKMLDVAQDNLKQTAPRKEYFRADAAKVAQVYDDVDIVTMNSVLHHLPDYDTVLEGLAKVIRPGGLFIITHERNSLFSKNPSLLLKGYRIARKNASTVYHLFVSRNDEKRTEFYQKVQDEIEIQLGLQATIKRINQVVDFHDPDEGGKGFDPFLLHRMFFREWQFVDMFFDRHLGAWVDVDRNEINRWLARKVRKKFPIYGAIFGMILRKPTE
jgi:ubiquinone/menaquinone biosynthesis C-methylase UbiE